MEPFARLFLLGLACLCHRHDWFAFVSLPKCLRHWPVFPPHRCRLSKCLSHRLDGDVAQLAYPSAAAFAIDTDGAFGADVSTRAICVHI
jgi:hypothetical protein